MARASHPDDHSDRDASIAINTYTTVLRRERTPHEVFATYWRDVHGPLCSRIPGIGWYVQNHFKREQDAHLWPEADGIEPFTDYVLDGGVEIGFGSAADQATFQDACSLLFTDEQNMFDATVAYDLPRGSTTLIDRVADPVPNGDDGLDRMHVHLGAAHDDATAFGRFVEGMAEALAADAAVLKARLHLPERYDNAKPAPPAPHVAHEVSAERELIAVLELAFASPMARRTFHASDAFRAATEGQAEHIARASAFAVSGVYTYVRDKRMTVAGLRGSRAAQLIERLGARNQIDPRVEHLLRHGSLT